MTYPIADVFYSIQGEGARVGTANVFIRFAGCNLRCALATHGFDCDTDFESRENVTRADLVVRCVNLVPTIANRAHVGIVLTGGEPLLRDVAPLCADLKACGFGCVQVETNGSQPIPDGIDYVTVSPKMAEHTLRAQRCDELKYVRAAGQPLPTPWLDARWRFLSPASTAQGIDRAALDWCIRLVRENPRWRLSMQAHKVWGIK